MAVFSGESVRGSANVAGGDERPRVGAGASDATWDYGLARGPTLRGRDGRTGRVEKDGGRSRHVYRDVWPPEVTGLTATASEDYQYQKSNPYQSS